MKDHLSSAGQDAPVLERLQRIRLLLLDVDGVLTDGRIVYDDRGVEVKTFNVKDGLGVKLLMAGGIRVGIVTGRRSKALDRRCRDLGIDTVYDGVGDKGELLPTILRYFDVDSDAVAFVGDDLPDIPIMKKVGLSIAVADAHAAVRAASNLVTRARGGGGAVREICEAVLKAQGLWEKLTSRFTGLPDGAGHQETI